MEEKEIQQNGMSQQESSNPSLPPEESQQAELNIDENVGGTTHLSDEMEEPSVVEKLENELAEYKDKYLRLVAEFDNYKKRTARERIELIQTAGGRLSYRYWTCSMISTGPCSRWIRQKMWPR